MEHSMLITWITLLAVWSLYHWIKDRINQRCYDMLAKGRQQGLVRLVTDMAYYEEGRAYFRTEEGAKLLEEAIRICKSCTAYGKGESQVRMEHLRWIESGAPIP